MTEQQLQKIAKDLRVDVVTMLTAAGSGHTASALGLAEIFSVLYFKILRHRPHQPQWSERDRLILSCGHVVPIRYAAMTKAGYYPKNYLKTLRKLNSKWQGHPAYIYSPALESSSGPLGQGLSVAVGLALGAKMSGKKYHVYCVTSDGEQNEGQTWEAYMSAVKYKLDNLTFILDRNNIQIDGTSDDVLPLEPLVDKLTAFGLAVSEIDGHNIKQIIKTLSLRPKKKPQMIIAKTVPGRGVDFMTNDYRWHGRVPDVEQATAALKQLKSL